jgi:hypothetical protein
MAIAEAPKASKPAWVIEGQSDITPKKPRTTITLVAENGLGYMTAASLEEAHQLMEEINRRVSEPDQPPFPKYRLLWSDERIFLPPAPFTIPGPFRSRVIMDGSNPLEMAKVLDKIAIPLRLEDKNAE